MSRRRAMRLLLGASGLAIAGCQPWKNKGGAPDRPPTAEFDALGRQIRGRLVTRDSAEYASLRPTMLWSTRTPNRYPDAIVRVSSAEDVQAAVRFARRNRMKVAIRGGGHSFCGSPLRDGGLLLDLSALNGISIDAAAGTATVQPAVQSGDLAAALAPHGQCFPVGHCPTVAMSGFLLNGGFGWNIGSWGPACLSVTGVDVVDARGELLHANAHENPDLYWAARGAGPGFFGVVTRFHLTLHALPKSIRTRTVLHRAEDMKAVGAWVDGLVGAIPPQVEMVCLVMPPPPDLPAGFVGPSGRVFAVIATAFADSAEEADGWLGALDAGPKGLESLSPPIEDTPIDVLHRKMSAAFVAHRRYAADTAWCDAAPSDVIKSLRGGASSMPTAESFLLIVPVAPPPASVPPMPDMALSMVSRVIVGVYGIGKAPDQDSACDAWVRRTCDDLKPLTVGYYIGEADLPAGPDRSARSFSPENWARLVQLRDKYDPDRVFYSYLGRA